MRRPKYDSDNYYVLDEARLMALTKEWRLLVLSGETNLRSAYLGDAKLPAAKLSGVNLRNAYLRNAQLQSAIMKNVNLRGALLENAQLEGADLSGADLRSTVCEHANWKNANLSGVNFIGADLSDSKNLDQAILPNYMRLLRSAGLSDLYGVRIENEESDGLFELRKYFRDRGEDKFGEFLELEIRLEINQVLR
jgi:uncharacterized protein YjbI with pentapeptide repeats